jgi:hypothetical protein
VFPLVAGAAAGMVAASTKRGMRSLDPLPPITAKVKTPISKVVARRAGTSNQELTMERAHQVFARMASSQPAPAPFFGLLSFGR